jgi:cytoskeletal protein RodZ
MDGQQNRQQPTASSDPRKQNSVLKVDTSDIDADQERLRYLRQIVPPKKPSKAKWVVLALIIIALGVAGYWGYNKFLAHDAAPTTVQKTTTPTKTTTNSTADVATKNYESTALGLTFAYPDTWNINEATGNKVVTAASPLQDIKMADGQTTKGKVMLTIAPKGQNLSAFTSGDAVAVRDSVKTSYSNPSSSQRAATYVSFLQYNSTTTKGALDAVAITGDYGYQKLQTIPKTDIASIDPLLMITFIKCSDAQCANSSAMSIPETAWDTSSFSKPLMAMLASLHIQ